MLRFTKACVAWVCLGLPAVAQESFSLLEVQVTANRYEQKKTGKTVTVLPDSVIRAGEGQTLSQILQAHGGLQVLGSGQPYGSVQAIALRGAGFGQTLILLDGIPVYEPAGIGATFDINLIPLHTVERIEILRDGQSTVYGSEAMAGVINIITRKHAAQKVQVSAGATGGSFGTFSGNAGVSGTLRNTQYRAAANAGRSRGFSSAAAPENSTFEKDGYRHRGVDLKIDQKITARWNARAALNFQNYHTDLDEAALVDDKDYTYTTDNLRYGGGIDYTLQRGKITFNYLGSTIHRTFTNDSADVSPAAWSTFSKNEYRSQSDFFDLYSHISLTKDVNLLAGASQQTQRMDYSGYEIHEGSRFDYESLSGHLAYIHNSSIYASVNGDWENGFGIEAGGRTNFHSGYGSTFTFTVNPYYVIDERLKVFASYGSSFRNPALYQLFSPYGNLNLNPERALTYEAGFRVEGEHARDFLRVLVFGRKYNDLIIFESHGQAPWGVYNNLAGKTTHRGAEVDGAKRWNRLTAGFTYTLLNGKVAKGLSTDEINAFLRRPNHSVSVNLGLAVAQRLTVGLQAQHLSQRNDSFYNPATYSSEAKILDRYTLVHLQAQYRLSPHLLLSVSGQNIFNVEYQEIYGYNSRKASFMGGLRANF